MTDTKVAKIRRELRKAERELNEAGGVDGASPFVLAIYGSKIIGLREELAELGVTFNG